MPNTKRITCCCGKSLYFKNLASHLRSRQKHDSRMIRKHAPSDGDILDKMAELDDNKDTMTDAEYLNYANGLLQTYRFWKAERDFVRIWRYIISNNIIYVFYYNHKNEAYCFQILM